jgi:hypothetical protein
MTGHIFLIGRDNFNIATSRGVYGVRQQTMPDTDAEVMASLEAIKPGDYVFFYVSGIGLFGLWKASSEAFQDKSFWPEFPYKVIFEPVIREFNNPVAQSDILDLRDKGKLWTFDIATSGRRKPKNHSPITADESKELIRLLLRNNPVFKPVRSLSQMYQISDAPLPDELIIDSHRRIKYEGLLNAALMKAFKRGKYKDVFGEYQDILNDVPTSFNTRMDIFLTHVTRVDGIDILHKYTCIELKTGTATESDLQQIVKYENWLVRKMAAGDVDMVQSVLIAADFGDSVLNYAKKRTAIEEKTVKLIKYRFEANNLTLEDVTLR